MKKIKILEKRPYKRRGGVALIENKYGNHYALSIEDISSKINKYILVYSVPLIFCL